MKEDKYTKKRYKAFINLEKEGLFFPVYIIHFPEGRGVSVALRLENENLTDEQMLPLDEYKPVQLKVDVSGGSLDIYTGMIEYRLGLQIHLRNVIFQETLQRRADIKVPMVEAGLITCLNEEKEGVSVPVTFLDISAGGVGFQIEDMEECVEEGDSFRLCFNKGKKPLYFDFEVCRKKELENGIINCGGRFFGLGKWQEAEIRKFVFEVERQEIIRQRKVQELLEQLQELEVVEEEGDTEE